MDRKQAIKTARESVSGLSRFGDQWKYSKYYFSINQWRDSVSGPFETVRQERSCDMLRVASLAMGLDHNQAYDIELDYINNGGNWTDYVPEFAQGEECKTCGATLMDEDQIDCHCCASSVAIQ